MRSEDFSEASPGRLVEIPGDALAFVPDPPPRALTLTAATVRHLGDTRARLAALVEGVRNLPAPDLLIAPFRKREAVLSSRIEGTRTTLDEAFADAVTHDPSADDGDPEPATDDVREVRNYERALRAGAQALATGRPLSRSLIADLHRELLAGGVRGETKNPGAFRDQQVWLGGPMAGDPQTARFVPPPPEQVEPCLDELASYLTTPDTDDPLIRTAIAHYQFETIHPFLDGNGRVGRLLVALQLVAEGLCPEPWLYVSPVLEQRRDAYYRGLFEVSARGAFTAWIDIFLDAIATAADDTLQRLDHLRALREKFETALQSSKSPRPARLLPLLFANPYLTVPVARRELQLSTDAAASRTIQTLVEAGILQRAPARPTRGSQRRRGRPAAIYRCEAILAVLDA